MPARESRFDLLRLLSMYMIVCGHLVYHGIRQVLTPELEYQAFGESATGQVNFVLTQLLGLLCNVGPNVFIMITGYFLIVPRTFRSVWNKGVRLWLTIVFYGVAIYSVAALCRHTFDSRELLTQLTPIYSTTYWFMTMYMGILLLSPFLAKMAQSLSRREYQMLLGVLLVMNFGHEQMGYASVYGSRQLFFIFIFLIGGYVRLHRPSGRWLAWTGAAYLLTCVALTGIFAVSQMVFHTTPYLHIKGLANNSAPLFTSVCLFLWFSSLPNPTSRVAHWAVRTSPYILSVYLIHEHSEVRALLWDRLIRPTEYLHDWYFLFYALGACAVVMAVCIAVDMLRKRVSSLIPPRAPHPNANAVGQR